MQNRSLPRPLRYDRRSALRRGAGILLFLLTLGLLGPAFFRLAWDIHTPWTLDEWLLVSLAAFMLLAGGVGMMLGRVETEASVRVWLTPLTPRDRRRFEVALAFSILFHALILSLQFGIPGIGLPGFGAPWAERRVQVSNLTVRLAEVPRPPEPTAEPLQLRAATSLELRAPQIAKVAPPLSLPRRETGAAAPAAKARARDREVRPKPAPKMLALNEPQPETFKVPPPKLNEPEPERAPDSAAKKQVEEPQAPAEAAEQTARKEAEDVEAKKLAEARRLEEARKREEARRQALELEARKLAEDKARQENEELARQRAAAVQKEQEAKKLEEALRIEEARKQEEARRQAEIRKQEEARRIAVEAETLKRAEELARQQALARQKELEARRRAEEAATRAKEMAERQRLDTEAAGQRERDRLAAEKAAAPAPGALAGRDLAAKALEQLRTPGATRDELLRPPPPPPRAENPRRRSLFGVERDVMLRMYVDSWRAKIERNGPLNYRASASWRGHEPAIVTVSIRSDGSLEDVFIHRSSGVRELDAAVQRIARLYAPYSAFPPALARQYDVIEIRRVWVFENTLRILDEM